MREIRLSGSEGGVADNGHLYPYRGCGPPARPHAQRRFGAAATLVGPESLGPLDTPRPGAQESDCHCAEH